jgi:methionyl-tRNA formyltransferase
MTGFSYCLIGERGVFFDSCRAVLDAAGFDACDARPDIVVAPLLRMRLTGGDLSLPRIGTLVFHPSLLPRYRGPDAIRWQLHYAEPVLGVTWFWASGEYDAGDICEQETVSYTPGMRARDIYDCILVPAGVRCLARAAASMGAGYVRRVPQDSAAATYFGKFPRACPINAQKHP